MSQPPEQEPRNHAEDDKERSSLYNESGMEIPVEIEDLDTLITLIEKHEKAHFSFVEAVFVDEAGIVEINKKHLDRDYVTDIITFRYDEDRAHHQVEGTLFCCAPRIAEQAAEFGEPVSREFRRILIHGLLHLLDYEDASDKEKAQMRELEERYLRLS